MLLEHFATLPLLARQILLSAIAAFTAYLTGWFLSSVVCRHLSAWAAKTAWKWDEILVDTLRQGIPIWTTLIGLIGALSFWSLPPDTFELFTKGVMAVLWLSFTMYLAGFCGRLMTLYATQRQPDMRVASITQNLIMVLIIGVGLLTILHSLGIPVTPALTALGVGGLAVALALQDTLSNLFSGFYLTMTRYVRVGDYIKLDSGQEGYVDDIGWRATMIRMPSNNTVVVPNNKLGQAILTNFYLPSRDMIMTVEVGVGYAADLAHVERVTVEVAREIMQTVTGGVPDFEPVLRFHTFGEYSVQGTVVLKVKEFGDQPFIKHQFLKKLHARYQQESIDIPYPTHVAIAEKTGAHGA
jgi:small-conductance mechanosensitive channel